MRVSSTQPDALSTDGHSASNSMDSSATRPYSVATGASEAFDELLKQCKGQIPKEFGSYSGNVTFVPSNHGDQVYFPSPCREQDAIAAIKALEACAAAAIGDLRHGKNSRSIKVDLDKAACFLMSAYLATIDGKRKGQTPKGLIPGKASSLTTPM